MCLDRLRDELDAADAPRSFCFRDDDAGWANERLFLLLDLFEEYEIPLDVAVIPAALDEPLAARLQRRADAAGARVAFHQHGFAHANHERSGRPCEFGRSRPGTEQHRDIAAGAERLAELLGETKPIFTPPWNRCTEATARCLVELGFRALARDAGAPRLNTDGLDELDVHVDWARPERRERVADPAPEDAPVGVMLHHESMDAAERQELAQLLSLLAEHENARCVALGATDP